MSTFFVKIGKAGVPAENVNPGKGDWEQGQFVAPKAKRPNSNPRDKPKFNSLAEAEGSSVEGTVYTSGLTKMLEAWA